VDVVRLRRQQLLAADYLSKLRKKKLMSDLLTLHLMLFSASLLVASSGSFALLFARSNLMHLHVG
jgi:hypothetical protein